MDEKYILSCLSRVDSAENTNYLSRYFQRSEYFTVSTEPGKRWNFGEKSTQTQPTPSLDLQTPIFESTDPNSSVAPPNEPLSHCLHSDGTMSTPYSTIDWAHPQDLGNGSRAGKKSILWHQFIQLSIDNAPRRARRKRRKKPVQVRLWQGIKQRFRASNYSNDHAHPLRALTNAQPNPEGIGKQRLGVSECNFLFTGCLLHSGAGQVRRPRSQKHPSIRIGRCREGDVKAVLCGITSGRFQQTCRLRRGRF